MSGRRILAAAAVLAVAAGLGLSAQSLLRAGDLHARLRGKARDLQAVHALADQVTAIRAGLRAFEALRDATLADPRELLAHSAPGIDAEVRARDPVAVLPGWELLGADITLPETALGPAGDFMLHAERARPPWRVTACSVQATTREGGRGRITITLEGLRPAPATGGSKTDGRGSS